MMVLEATGQASSQALDALSARRDTYARHNACVACPITPTVGHPSSKKQTRRCACTHEFWQTEREQGKVGKPDVGGQTTVAALVVKSDDGYIYTAMHIIIRIVRWRCCPGLWYSRWPDWSPMGEVSCTSLTEDRVIHIVQGDYSLCMRVSNS